MRIRTKSGSFGTLKSEDDESEQEFEAYEIVIHTPAEHHIMNRESDMEVQVLHRTTAGDFK